MKIEWHDILFPVSILYFCISLFSCSEEIEIASKGEESSDEAYFSLTLGTNAEELTDITRNSYMVALAAENKVSSVYLVLYDEMTEEVKYQIPLDINNGDGSANFTGGDVLLSNDAITFQVKAQKIKRDNYKVLVLINPQQHIITQTQVGKHLYDFESAKRLNLNQLATTVEGTTGPGAGYTNIFMSNGLNYGKINKDINLFKTASDAVKANNAILIGVDRIVAKVILEKNANIIIYPVGSGARFESVKWQLDNVNKQTFLMRQAAPMLNNESESSIPPGTHRLFYRGKLYATDPNWDHISNDRIRENGGVIFPDLSDSFYQIKREHIDQEFADPALLLPDNKSQYVLENTMNSDEQWEDVTTRILIKANYIPANFNANADYYYYNNKAYSLSELNTMRNNGSWDSEGLRNTIRQAISEDFFTAVTGTSLGNPANSKSTVNGLLRYYKNGLSYYYILIRHFDDTEVPARMGYGRYGIVRNNVYLVSITSVNGPGSPEISDTQGPDDKEYKYLSAQINVLPWTVRSQSNIIDHPYPP